MSKVRSAVLDHPEPNSIEMKLNKGFKGLYAGRDILAGAVIFELKGRISTRGTKYSVQLGRDEHLDFPLIRKPNDDLDYAWQFVNHSCEPNSYVNVAAYAFCALRNISKGEEITFNYLTTEYELAAPFQCECRSAKCFGFIRGYKFLTADQMETINL